MTLNPKPAEKTEFAFCDGWYVVNGLKVPQSMFFTASTNETGKVKAVKMFKGVRMVCFCISPFFTKKIRF